VSARGALTRRGAPPYGPTRVPPVDSAVLIAVISAAAGLATATIGALVKGAVNRRADVNEDLRAMRLTTYPVAWTLTGDVPTWPERELTYGALRALHERLRAWYYGTDEFAERLGERPGGLSLSTNGRERYGNVQEIIAINLRGSDDGEALVPHEAYEGIRDSCSAFRTALAEDLDTRRMRSILYARQLRHRHRAQELQARARLEAAERRVGAIPAAHRGGA
jgi:hypothetical protein